MSFTKADILYYMLKKPVKLYLEKKFNIYVENNELINVNEPYLLLGHHVTVFDPIISNLITKRLVRYVAADANYDNIIKKILLNQFESIPFPKNRFNTKPIHKILNHIKKGFPIGLYPEGGRTWDGATDKIIPSTAKLIKLLKIPVYAIFYKGGYLSNPRWSSYLRKGKMVLEVKKIMEKDTIQEKSTNQLYKILVDELSYNEFDWQEKERVVFKGKNLAEDIERLLYVCPNCFAVNSFISNGDRFLCKTCKKEYTVNQYGKIEGCWDFQETVSWNRWQKKLIPNIISNGFSFHNSKILLEKYNAERNIRNKQLVLLSITQDNIIIEYNNGEKETIYFNDLSGISITFMDVLEFFVGNVKYRFKFNPKKHMSINLFYDLVLQIKEDNKNGFGLGCSY